MASDEYGILRMIRLLRQRVRLHTRQAFLERADLTDGTVKSLEEGRAGVMYRRGTLHKLAMALCLRPGSVAYQEFMDRGDLACGRLPDWGCRTPLEGERFVELVGLFRRDPSLVVRVTDWLREEVGCSPPAVLPEPDDCAHVVECPRLEKEPRYSGLVGT